VDEPAQQLSGLDGQTDGLIGEVLAPTPHFLQDRGGECLAYRFTRTRARGVAGDLCWFPMMLTLGLDPILDAGAQHVRSWVALMDERLDAHAEQVLSQTARARRVVALSSLLRWAAQEELIAANPVDKLNRDCAGLVVDRHFSPTRRLSDRELDLLVWTADRYPARNGCGRPRSSRCWRPPRSGSASCAGRPEPTTTARAAVGSSRSPAKAAAASGSRSYWRPLPGPTATWPASPTRTPPSSCPPEGTTPWGRCSSPSTGDPARAANAPAGQAKREVGDFLTLRPCGHALLPYARHQAVTSLAPPA